MIRRLRCALPPGRFGCARFALALAVGAGGGWLFARLSLPLPWMLGSMAACTLAALLRAPIGAPSAVRPPMQMIIGVLLGAGFTPEVLGSLSGWIPTLAGLALFVLACGAICTVYFRKVGRLDPVSAYFAGMPGGLIEMVALGEQRGGDARTIALVHSARILLIVFALPFLASVLTGVDIGARPATGLSVLDTPWDSEVWLVATALAGGLLGRLLRLPAATLLGPMLASAGVHALGVTGFQPAYEVVNGAQLVLGTAIGCRFAGVARREVLRVLLLTLGSAVLLLALTLLFAVLVSRVSAFGIAPVMLAYSPGGLAEMSLVAVSLQIEVAFVAAHHIARIFLVTACASTVFRILGRRSAAGDGSARRPS